MSVKISNFKNRTSKTNELVKTLSPQEMELPPLETVPLFDFGFNEITSNARILSYRSVNYPSLEDGPEFLEDSCWTQSKYREMLKAAKKKQ